MVRRANTPDDATQLDVDRYLHRLDLEPETVEDPDFGMLARLQDTHVTTIPFENLSIVGDPHAETDDIAPGPGVELTIPTLFEKIVDRERGGYCFELNGLFATLLATLGYDVDRVPARVDGGLTVPANHHAIVVTLDDQRYVVDVGTGAPMIRQPLPFDGTTVEDAIGVSWRVTASDRPDETHQVEYLEPDTDAWSTRYVFSHVPVDLNYFRATNDYLQSAPESSFTGDPTIQIATDDGHRKLTLDGITDPLDDDAPAPVSLSEWAGVLETEFGLRPPARR